MLLLPETQLEDAARTAERLRESMAQRSLKDPCDLSCSFGVCQFQPGEAAAELVHRADKALYEAKKQGRNRVVVCKQDATATD